MGQACHNNKTEYPPKVYGET